MNEGVKILNRKRRSFIFEESLNEFLFKFRANAKRFLPEKRYFWLIQAKGLLLVEIFAVICFKFTVSHSVDKFKNEQQILGPSWHIQSQSFQYKDFVGIWLFCLDCITKYSYLCWKSIPPSFGKRKERLYTLNIDYQNRVFQSPKTFLLLSRINIGTFFTRIGKKKEVH